MKFLTAFIRRGTRFCIPCMRATTYKIKFIIQDYGPQIIFAIQFVANFPNSKIFLKFYCRL